MLRTTVTLPQSMIDELVPLMQASSKTQAVQMALKEQIRLRKVQKIKSMAGKLSFTATAEELRHGDERLG